MHLKEKLSILLKKKQKQSNNQSQQSNQKISTCKVCFKPIEGSIHSIVFKNPTICQRCLGKFKPVLNEFKVSDIDAYHLYFYNDAVKEFLYQFKGCFDIELGSVFLEYYLPFLKIKYRGYYLIPAPSYEEANITRGFNHVKEIFKFLNLPLIDCVKKLQNIKQADLKSEERKNIDKYLKIDNVDLTKKKILIVDDVYTTGSTIKAIINLVKPLNPKKIQVLVMSKTQDKNITV